MTEADIVRETLAEPGTIVAVGGLALDDIREGETLLLNLATGTLHRPIRELDPREEL